MFLLFRKCDQLIWSTGHWSEFELMTRCTTCYKICQWLATIKWFSPGTPLSSTNKTDHHVITERGLYPQTKWWYALIVQVVVNPTTIHNHDDPPPLPSLSLSLSLSIYRKTDWAARTMPPKLVDINPDTEKDQGQIPRSGNNLNCFKKTSF